MVARNDDVAAFLQQRTRAHQDAGKHAKIKQTWHGLVGVGVDPSQVEQLADALENLSNQSWHILDVTRGPNWVAFLATYTVKGANSNDAVQLVRRFVDVPDDMIMIDWYWTRPA